MFEKLEVLTMESVEKLRHYLPENPEVLLNKNDSLLDDLRLKFIRTDYLISCNTCELIYPDSRDQSGLKDAENCMLILKILPNLSPADATDERIWTTLSIFQYRDYALSRWPIENQNKEKRVKHIKNHWFANGVRGRMRDNAISRLWWMAHIATKVPKRSQKETLELLLVHSDYRSSLLERNTSANAVNVTASILEVTRRAYDKGVPFSRTRFRSFMKDIDLLGGRLHLAALDYEKIVEIITPIYNEAYDIE